jgi:shikimate dehydrogenase
MLLAGRRPRALVLGTGGSAKAVCHALGKLGLDYTQVSRTPKPCVLTYAEITAQTLSDHKLIINATPVGMTPHEDAAPDIPYDALTEEHILFDLIYAPEQTQFLKFGAQRNTSTRNGMGMLIRQAELSWEVWNELFI